MPGKHRVDRDYLTLVVTRELREKINEAARMCGLNRNAWANRLFEEAVKDIQLSETAKKKIADQIREAKERRHMTWANI